MLTLAQLTVIDATPEEAVDAAAAGGFDGLGLRVYPVPSAPGTARLVDEAERVVALRRRAEDSGVEVLDIEALGLAPQLDRDLLRRALDAGAGLGARFALAMVHDPDPVRAADSLGWLADEARPRGLRLGVEFVPFPPIQLGTSAAALDLIRAAGRSNVGLVVDTLHLQRSGGDPADLADLPPDAHAWVQLCDAPAANPPADELPVEARTDRLIPGDGELPLRRLLEVVPPGVPLSLETPVRALAHHSPVERARILGREVRAYLAGERWPATQLDTAGPA